MISANTRRAGVLEGIVIIVVLAGLVVGQPVVAGQKATGSTLDQLVAEAMTGNQEIASLAAKAEALRAEAPFAGSLKDPVLGFALLNLPADSFAFDQQPMTQKQISLSQQVPWFGKLSLAELGAELMAAEQEAMVAAMRLSVARQLKDAWYELCLVERSLDINLRMKSLVSQVLEVAESRYATGDGLQQDVLMGQVQLSELIDRQVALQAAKTRLQDGIGALLNREDLFMVGGGRLAEPPIDRLDRERLTAEAFKNNPLIGARRAAVMKAEVDVELAEKDYMPDMNFTVAYGQRDDLENGQDSPDFFSAGVSLTVPLWQNTRQDSKLAGAKQRLHSARRSLQALEKTLPHRVDGLLAEIHGARESRELYTEAVSVQAGQLADASLAAYSVGRVEFNTLLQSKLRLLQVELKEEQYLAQVNKKLAELEETVGADPLAMEVRP